MKNGELVCVAFPNPNKNQPSKIQQNRSSETTSFSSDVFKVKPNVHAGMHRKPLEPYHPNAHRNRLTSPSVVMPYKNSSQIVIGDRSSQYRRQFVTTSNNMFNAKAAANPLTSNPGITSEIVKRNKGYAAQ